MIEPTAKAKLPAGALEVLQEAMAKSIHTVFWVGAILSIFALGVTFLLPKSKKSETVVTDGEMMLMAEHTTIDPKNEPVTEG